MQSTYEAADQQATAAMVRYRAGIASAFDDLCRAVRPRLVAFFVRITGEESASEDLAQDVLLRLYGARDRLHGDASIMPLVFTIARRLLIDRARHNRREVLVPLDEELDTADATPAAIVESKQIAGRLIDLLDQLPNHHREAFELVRHEGLPVAAVAKRLGTTVCAVKLRTHRASLALRAGLAAA
jgi:RNA polymerase sigma-70 factor (ECF subfamily)